MAREIDLGADDGFADVSMAGVTRRIDIFDADSRRAAIASATANEPSHVWAARCVDLVKELGFPEVSQRSALRFMAAIHEAAVALEKKDETALESPASTV